MRKVATIVRANLRRAARDRTALFFSILLPIILILVLGLTYGSGASARVGIVDQDAGAGASRLVDEIRAQPGLTVDIRPYGDVEALRDAASRGIVEIGIVIPAGYTAALQAGDRAQLSIVSSSSEVADAIRATIDRAIAAQAALVRAARFDTAVNGISPEQAQAAAAAVASSVSGVTVSVEPVNAAPSAGDGFGRGAQSQLVLFMFLTSLTAAVELVITRQLGISRRMLSTPTSLFTIVLGESTARIAFAALQGIFIVVASALLFGVQWGEPAGVAIVVAVFALTCGGAAMLVGSLASSPSQAGALGPALGLLFGLLGGAMVPTEVFPSVMQTLSRLTPHAWAMDALGKVGEPGSSVASIAPDLLVLALFTGVFFAVAAWRFRRVLTTGS